MSTDHSSKSPGVSQGSRPSRTVGGDRREVPHPADGGPPERPVRPAAGVMGGGRPSSPLPPAAAPSPNPPPRRQTREPLPPGGARARQPPAPDGKSNEVLRNLPGADLDAFTELSAQADAVAAKLDPELEKAVGFTHFDTASSQDNLITLLMTRDDLHKLPSQTLVRVKSMEDKRSYLGVVVRGPFSEPDAVAANSTIAVGVVVQGKKLSYTFDYHGRAEIEILGEESAEGTLIPPGHRPRPKSPVFLLDEEESEHVLGMQGELSLGMVVGYKHMEARIDALDKSVLPRHTGIIGTTGGGKSTTVATLIHRAQSSAIATIVFDVEGEYTHVDQPTDDPTMLAALTRRKQLPEGVKDLHIHHLTGRDTRNRRHKHRHPFALNFSSLSPHAIAEILEMTDAQVERFHKAYEVTKLLLEEFKIFPRTPEEQRQLMELDDLSTGHPRMSLQHVLDVVSTYIYALSTEGKAESKAKTKGSRQASLLSEGAEESAPEAAFAQGPQLYSEFKEHVSRVLARVHEQSSRNEVSWRALFGRLLRLRRLKVFDVGSAPSVDYDSMLTPGRVSVIDLSDTDSPQINNLVIADILRGIQERQEERCLRAQEQGRLPDPALIIIEEAHEFLSAQRITQMPVLFQQVARIAKRGRKRWLGLVFVTQLPQHLPNEVLGLLNNFIIHKMTDSTVIARMQKSVGGIDEGLWGRVPRLAPGQAIASFSSFKRPLMIAVDPAPVKRMLVD